MKKTIAWLMVVLTLACALAVGTTAVAEAAWEWWDEEEDGEYVYGRTNEADLKLRESAQSRGKIVVELPDDGTMVILLGVGENSAGESWFYVQVGEYVGYLQASYVDLFSYEDLFSEPDDVRYGYTNQENVKLREASHSRGKILAELPDAQTMVIVMDSVQNNAGETWYYVRAGEYDGYIPASSVDDFQYEDFDAEYARTSEGGVKLRERDHGRARIIVELPDEGTLVTLLSSSENSAGETWYYVQVDGYEGYLPASAVGVMDTAQYETYVAGYGRTAEDGAKIRETAYSRGKIVKELGDAGALVTIVDTVSASDGSAWYQVQAGAYEGYLPTDSVTLVDDGDYEEMLSSASSRERSAASSEALTDGYAWIVPDGERYHRSYSCSNMNGPWQVTIEEAEDYGLFPCQKCWR